MKIQLLFADQELELTKDVQLPINKAFQNLWNPTDIIVDYSKTISIPMTVNNNRVLGNAYRLDRVVIDRYRMRNGDGNIGVYLDPTKKIPFQLLYNGQSLMEGYAKFTSASYSENKRCYNFNLFGSLGGYFLKMQDVKTSQDKLTDDQKNEGGDIYVLNDHMQKVPLTSQYVYDSWMKSDNNINDFSDPSITNYDIIGFAPSYRGYYEGEFSSDKVQVNSEEIKLLSEVLERKWMDTYSRMKYYMPYDELPDEQKEVVENYVGKLNADALISDGLMDYQMDEYRSYHMKPYIYFNKLLYMFKEKSKELTGYDLILDDSWFNEYNPYWTKLIYTLNFLEDINTIPTNKIDLGDISLNSVAYQNPSDGVYCKWSGRNSFPVTSDKMNFNGRVVGQLSFDNTVNRFNPAEIHCVQKSYIVYEINIRTASANRTKRVWSYLFSDTYNPPESYLNEDNRITTKVRSNADRTAKDILNVWFECDFDNLELDVPLDDKDVEVTVSATLKNHYAQPVVMIERVSSHVDDILKMWNYYDRISPSGKLTNFNYKTTNNESINVGLDVLYLEEEPLFNVIIQYTKMYGLLWKLDDVNKTVTICRRSTYFDHISEPESWDHKVDRSKDYTIEPIAFDTKYVLFNYEDVDGYKYKSYADKYGVSYGSFKLNTSYDFDSGDAELFKGVNPSMTSQRSFNMYSDFHDWNMGYNFYPKKDIVDRIESASSDNEQGLNSSSWYFRGDNIEHLPGSYITDDSDLMKSVGEKCYYSRSWIEECIKNNDPRVKKIHVIPTFSVVNETNARKYGCLFNCPKEDYVSNQLVSKARGYYIYDNFWEEYINERYNVQNKKVTLFLNITPYDFLNFDFNKFITIGGQLFMINKIFDYDLNSTSTTKCELVQVSDLSAYTEDKISFKTPSDLPKYTLNVVTTPDDAKVYMNSKLTKSLEVEHGTEVYVEVSANNYYYWSDTIIVTEDYTLNVDLLKDTSIMRTFTIFATPYDAKVVINGVEAKSLAVHNWDEVEWTVSKEGYHTKSGTTVVTQDISIPVNLSEDFKDVITFTIIPEPADAFVSINASPTTSIETEPGANITWIVRKDGYTTQSNTFKIYESQTLNVVLEKKGVETAVFTINPTPSDAYVSLYVRSDGDSPSPYHGTEVKGNGTQSVTVAVGDWISWSATKDGYKTAAGLYQMTTSENFTYDAVLEELGVPTYELLSHPDPIQTISADAQSLVFKVSSRKMIPRPDGSGSDVQFLDINASKAVNCTVTKQDSISGDAKEFVVKVTENVSSEKRYCSFTVTQDETGDTLDFNITQAFNSYEFEAYSLTENMTYEGGQGTCWIRSLKNGNKYPINLFDVSITGITGATVDSVKDDSLEHEDGAYGIVYTIPRNNGSANRTAVLTVTHPVTKETITFNIEQNYFNPSSTKKVNTVITPIFNSNMGTVSYELYFDATNFNGGTLRNVWVEVRNTSNVTGDLLASKSYGDITVAKGSKSETYVGMFRNIDILNPWVLVYYDNNLQYKANCMQEVPDPMSESDS